MPVDETHRAGTGVVVPVYNGRRWLADALTSLQAQTVSDWVAVVVDDGSTDGSAELARQVTGDDPRFRVVSQPNAGVAAARQRGLAELPEAVEHVAFLDADDRYEPDALAVLRERLGQRPDAVGVYCLARYVDPAGRPILAGAHEAVQRDRRVLRGRRAVAGSHDTDLEFDSLVFNSVIWPAAVVLLRVAAVREVGGPDPSFPVQEDWELYLRLSRLGPFVTVPDTLVDYRRHDANLTATEVRYDFHQDRIRHKAWRSADNTPAQRRTVSRAWRYLQLRQIREHARLLGAALRRHDAAGVARIGVAIALCTLSLVLPGPPRPHRRVSALMHAVPPGRKSWQQS